MKVRDLMTRPAVTVRPTDRLSDVARLLIERHVSGLPVVDAGGALLGVVSETDIVLRESRGEWPGVEAQTEASTAATVMTGPAITIGPDEPLQAAAVRMIERQVNRLPVVEGGRVIGVISRADLVRAYVRSDSELVETIRDEVLRRILWLDPDLFSVAVSDGNVRIEGWVERRSTLDLLDWAARLVPGVASVTLDVTWSLDDTEGAGVPQPAMRDLATANGRRAGTSSNSLTG